jgi:lipopolysaccharide export system protein LptC
MKAGTGMVYAALGGGRLPHASSSLPRDSHRDLEFQRARGHSRTVAVLKGALPLMAAFILSLYVLPRFLKVSIDNGRGEATAKSITVEAGTFTIKEPHVAGVTERGEPYDITATSAKQRAGSPEVMYLEAVRGKMTSRDGKLSILTAPDAIHNNKTEEISFENGVEVNQEGGISASFQKATASMKNQAMVSKLPVTIHLHESTINADGLTLYWNESRAIFEGNVRTRIVREPEAASGGQQAGATGTQAVDVTAGVTGDSNGTQ